MIAVLRGTDVHHWVNDFTDALLDVGQPFERRETGRRITDLRPNPEP